ncbi:hypothetical protein J6S55_00910 [Candidatus Saccharibacteria bacterium]|nr:hypothetical protein [Candidatus Saccharibacteria bacterium]
MKVDLTTAIVAAIFGVVVSYLLVSNVFLKDPSPVIIKTLSTSVGTNLTEPSAEVFNYRALNPTIEVYIDCSNYDASGSCVNNTENQ